MIKIRHLLCFLALTLLLAGCISIPTGDGGKIKLSKDGMEIENQDGEKSTVNVDNDDGGFSLTTEGDGNGTEVTVNMGTHAKVPDDFPQDIILPSEEFLVMSGFSPKDQDDEHSINSITLNYQVKGDFTENKETYDAYLVDNGYEVERLMLGDAMHNMMGTKGNHSLSISFFVDEGEQSYMLQFIYFYE